MSSVNKNGDWKCAVCKKWFVFGTTCSLLKEPLQGESIICMGCVKEWDKIMEKNEMSEKQNQIEFFKERRK